MKFDILLGTRYRNRLLVATVFNLLRALFGFVSSLMIARSLGPALYGELMFALLSVSSLWALLDAGATNAFYTFVSSRDNIEDCVVYLLWLVIRFVVIFCLIFSCLSRDVFDYLFVSSARNIVILSLVVIFAQNGLLQFVTLIFESKRNTVCSQGILFCVSVVYCGLLYILHNRVDFNCRTVVYLLIMQNFLGFVVGCILLYKYIDLKIDIHNIKQSAISYIHYCYPLFAVCLVTFFYDFFDKWLLQSVGGPTQQGYFQISSQLSALIIMITSSLSNIYWKEVAVCYKQGLHDNVEKMYNNAIIWSVLICSCLSSIAISWLDEIIFFFYGSNYIESRYALYAMLLYPIHLPLGMVGGATLLAMGKTRVHSIISTVFMLVSMPITAFFLLPEDCGVFSGFGMGAFGLGMKMLCLNIISTNIQSYVITRINGWSFKWRYQLYGVFLAMMLGYFSKHFVMYLDISSVFGSFALFVEFMLSNTIFFAVVVVLLTYFQKKFSILKNISEFRYM